MKVSSRAATEVVRGRSRQPGVAVFVALDVAGRVGGYCPALDVPRPGGMFATPSDRCVPPVASDVPCRA